MFRFFIATTILFSLFYSCCKDGETIYIYSGVKASLYQVGASELNCNNYKFLYFLKLDGKIHACTNLPDSLNISNPSWSNYEIQYKLLPNKLQCKVWGSCCQEIPQIELISAKRY